MTQRGPDGRFIALEDVDEHISNFLQWGRKYFAQEFAEAVANRGLDSPQEKAAMSRYETLDVFLQKWFELTRVEPRDFRHWRHLLGRWRL